MTQITAAMVKELREKSGAGMMDAKKALVENDGDMEKAIDYLRKKGVAKADKKSSRTAAEGLVAMKIDDDGKSGVLVEVNSETDFVAKNDEFQTFVRGVADVALDVLGDNSGDVEALKSSDMNCKSVKESLTDLIAKIGENMNVRRCAKLCVDNGCIVGYVHNAQAPGLGKIGVLVALESDGDPEKLQALGKQIAMHVAAAFPQYLDRSQVGDDVVERERKILIEQAKAEGKPEEIAEKMVTGRIEKFYKEICLMEQMFIMDNKINIKTVLENAAGDVGAHIKLLAYERFQLGEGIEKKVENFAEEVAKTVNG